MLAAPAALLNNIFNRSAWLPKDDYPNDSDRWQLMFSYTKSGKRQQNSLKYDRSLSETSSRNSSSAICYYEWL